MSRATLPLLLLMILSGCFPVTLYYQEGVQVTEVEATETRCKVSALKEVPRATRSRYIPPTYAYRPVCNAQGQCGTARVPVSPGRWETYDANEDLRAEVAQLCMREQGFERVRLKPCPPTVVEQTTMTATTVLPPLGPQSCMIRLTSGHFKIVTPRASE